MENKEDLISAKQASPEALPSLIKYITSNEVAGFDRIEGNYSLTEESPSTGFQPFSSSANGTKTAAAGHISQNDGSQPITAQRLHSVSISMPSSPTEVQLQTATRVPCSGTGETIFDNGMPDSSFTCSTTQSKQAKFHSQPLPTVSGHVEAIASGNFPIYVQQPLRNPRIDRFKDTRYDSFKTWSGKLEKQLSNLRGKPRDTGPEDSDMRNPEIETLPVDRYFDALEGPELDTLRASEELVLPGDKWPFLLRYPISSFGICLGVSSQAIMWKTLATASSMKFLHVSLTINLILWCISVLLVAIVSFIYCLKIILYFEAVRREYYHPIRVNFFFAPWIALLFLALGVPPSLAKNLHSSLWYVLMAPILCLEIKIYGQWMSGGQRRLSKVANPSNHLSIVGNFVGALLGASMGLKEGPIFFYSVGLAHYMVLFVTLYQRLPTNETLPKELHPVFFLFVAAPSVASMAWARIQGSFDYGSKISYFIAVFLYISLAVRVNFFRGFRFSIAWWAYTFPMTGASIATIKYSTEVTNIFTQSLSVVLSAISTLTVTALLVTTVLHAFVLGDLFPNDIGIAISEKKSKSSRKWFNHLRHGSLDISDHVDDILKFGTSNGKDVEASLKPPSNQ